MTAEPGVVGRTPGAARAFLGSVGLSSLGDGFRYAALPMLLVLYDSSPAVLGSLLAIGTVPFLLVGLVGGAVVDRFDRVRVLRLTDLSRFAACAIFAALLAFGAPASVVVPAAFVLAFVMGVGEALAFPAIFALTPTVVEPADLKRFNGRLSAFQTLGRDLLGPLAGSALVVSVAPGPFAVDALTFAVSWLLLSRLGSRPAAERAEQPRRLVAEIGAGFRWLVSKPALITLSIASALINLGNMGFLATAALYAVRALDSPAVGYGALLASASVGGTVMAFAVGRVTGRGSSLLAVPVACVVIAGGMVTLALAPGLVVAVVGSFFTGVGFALYNVTVTTARHQLTPDEWRGRADSLYRLVAWGVLPLGSLLGGLVADAAGLRAPAAVAAGAALIAAVWVSVTTLRLKT